MPQIGAVADDLTGATTMGVLLARDGARTAAYFNEYALKKCSKAKDFTAIMVSSNSRALPPMEAYEKVKSATLALKELGVTYFSKRIDTTLRGGIGYEIDAMMDQMDGDPVAVVVPAMPQSRRILVGGYSVIDGVALIKTPVAQDVRTPVKENYIPDLLAAQTKREVGLVPLRDVLAGTGSIQIKVKQLMDAGKRVIVIDAVDIEDIRAIADAVVSLDLDVVAVDPGAFTEQLAFRYGAITPDTGSTDADKAVHEENGRTVLIAAGSATPVTKRQMGILLEDERHYHIPLSAAKLAEGGDETLAEIIRGRSLAEEALEGAVPPRVIVFSTALEGEPLNLEEEDRKRGYEQGMCANRINAGLGNIIAGVLETKHSQIAGLYTTGGDTMVNVCYQLGVESIELIDYVIPQTDIGRLVGNYDGMPVVGKGGLTGHDHIASEIVERLFRESNPETVYPIPQKKSEPVLTDA